MFWLLLSMLQLGIDSLSRHICLSVIWFLLRPSLVRSVIPTSGATVVDVGGVEAEGSVVERFVGPFGAVVGHRVFLRMG